MLANQSPAALTKNLVYSLIVNREMSKPTYHLEGLVGSRRPVSRNSAETMARGFVLDQDCIPFEGLPALLSSSNSHVVLDG